MKPPAFALGLIGYPLEKSLSPALQQAALQAAGLKGAYQLYPIASLPAGKDDLVRMLQQLRTRAVYGLNVTIPHKQNVLPYLDALTPAAAAIGAANTLYMDGDHLTGDNTDIPGFLYDLQRLLPETAGHALVLGAGGSARAVVYALAGAGWQVTVAARRPWQASALLEDLALARATHAISLETQSLAGLSDLTLVVNTTPVGMLPNPEASPWPAGAPLPRTAAVYDLIYKPLETRLMRQAQAAGLRAINGLGMLVEQAALSFERWTGSQANRAAMWQAVSTQQAAPPP
jgi:shikimate dehydrogenase